MMVMSCANCEVYRNYRLKGRRCTNFRKTLGINIEGVLLNNPILSYCYHPYGSILVVEEGDEDIQEYRGG